jgi:hypothetical protein
VLEEIDLAMLCELATLTPTSEAVARLRERLRASV